MFLGAGGALAVAAALFAVGMAAYRSANLWVDHTSEVRTQVYEWQATLLDAETGARGYVATGDAHLLSPYEQAFAQERRVAATLRQFVSDNPAQARRVDAASVEAQGLMQSLGELVALVRSGRRDQAAAQLDLGESRQRMDAFRSDSAEILSQESTLLAERRAHVSSGGWVALCGAILLALAASGLLLIGWKRERKHDAIVTVLAREARGRLRDMFELATALSGAGTRAHVAEVLVEHGARIAGADICTLYELSEEGDALDLIGERGCAPEVLEAIRRVTPTSGNPAAFQAVKSARATWAESEADYEALYPALARLPAAGARARAFWSLPLVVEGRPIGLLGAGYYRARTFSRDERTFIETLADQSAQALMRAARFEREENARQWFTTTLRSIGDAVIATDTEGRVTFLNAVAARLTGWTERDARGRPLDEVFSIFSEATRLPVESPVAKVLREGAVIGLANHTVLRSKEGLEIPIDDSGAPIRGEDGRLLGVVLVFRDVTVEKRARARSEFLSKAGEALASTLDYERTLAAVARLSVPILADWCAIDLLDPPGGALRQVAVAHVDPTRVQMAREYRERYPPDPNATRGGLKVARTGRAELYPEIDVQRLESLAKDEEQRRFVRELRLHSAMLVPIRGRGRNLGVITLIHAESRRKYTPDDLTFAEDFARRAGLAIENAMALKEAEQARARERGLRDGAELASRAKDEFLATVSHELRTPLNAILGWTVIIRRRELGYDLDRAMGIIERNARAQARLINDVLDLSRVISGKMILSMTTTRIADTVAAAVETVAPAAAAKGIQIDVDVPDRSLEIVADADRLQQVIWNLLSNSVKFTPKDGHVFVSVRQMGSDVKIVVRDTGEGIRDDLLPVIFKPFQQADNSTTRHHGGLGLGLTIARQLVGAHGGSVHAESEGPGKGATFVVELPKRAAVSALVRAPRAAASTLSLEPEKKDPTRLDGLRLLVVDDEDDARTMLAEVLRDHGADVQAAGSAREALERFGAVRPDVLVSDIGMPETDGYSLIREIRSRPPQQGGGTPAVALTAYAQAEDEQRALTAGYQVHVPKPVEPSRLAAVVATLGGRGRDEAPSVY